MNNNNKSHISFWFWVAGYMFTLGYMSSIINLESMKWWQQILTLIATYVFWPLVLGSYIGTALK
jgi:hypothetical protein